MGKKAGFTLVQLLVVIFSIMLLMVLILPILSQDRPLAKRAGCTMNVRTIGQCLAMYTNANNGKFPYLPANAAWDVASTGANRDKEPTGIDDRSTSSLLFMLVRDGQSAKYFNCPADKSIKECVDIKNEAGNYYWDFSSASNLSYSYQVPMADNSNGLFEPIESTSQPTSQNYVSPSLIIMADKSPTASLKDIDLTKWQQGLSPEDSKKYMSQNHEKGDYINLLRADYSVGNAKSPDVGIDNDYIYTASDKDNSGARYGGKAAQAAHKFKDDSYLAGPK